MMYKYPICKDEVAYKIRTVTVPNAAAKKDKREIGYRGAEGGNGLRRPKG
jgi:hypothetical protein